MRLIFYSHDTFGLGHLRPGLAIVRYVRRRRPTVSQVIVTGSPVPQGAGNRREPTT